MDPNPSFIFSSSCSHKSTTFLSTKRIQGLQAPHYQVAYRGQEFPRHWARFLFTENPRMHRHEGLSLQRHTGRDGGDGRRISRQAQLTNCWLVRSRTTKETQRERRLRCSPLWLHLLSALLLTNKIFCFRLPHKSIIDFGSKLSPATSSVALLSSACPQGPMQRD